MASKEEKVYQLTEELLTTQNQKKASMRGFNDEIKRIKKEIEELISETSPSTETEPEE